MYVYELDNKAWDWNKKKSLKVHLTKIPRHPLVIHTQLILNIELNILG